MRRFVVLCSLALAACHTASSGSDAHPGAGSPPKPGAAPAPAAAPPAASLVDVELTPMPLTIRVPKGGMGALDMSIGDKKSVTVDIGEGVSLNVQDSVYKSMNDLKASYKGDKILFPFKRFVREDAASFTVEITGEHKQSGFIGVALKELGGKKYVCKTTGLNGVASAELAEQQLKACDRLKAK
jgi:hypothetical protein